MYLSYFDGRVVVIQEYRRIFPHVFPPSRERERVDYLAVMIPMGNIMIL